MGGFGHFFIQAIQYLLYFLLVALLGLEKAHGI